MSFFNVPLAYTILHKNNFFLYIQNGLGIQNQDMHYVRYSDESGIRVSGIRMISVIVLFFSGAWSLLIFSRRLLRNTSTKSLSFSF